MDFGDKIRVDPVAQSVDLDKRIAESKVVVGLVSYGRQSRRLTWITIVSVMLDILLSVAVFFYARTAVNATRAAQRADVAQSILCLAANEFRKDDLASWLYVISLSPAKTPDSQARANDFIAFKEKQDAPVNCHLSKG